MSSSNKPRTAPLPSGVPGSNIGALPALLGLIVLLLLAFASSAQAGPPRHLPLPDPIGGYPLNHACGTAVDSQGDLYVSNAGEAKIEVFDPAGAHLASIPDAHEPCGLAVDSTGNLYVSERATGEVVRYHPLAYPFAGTPGYEVPALIDASGKAHGISVDSSDDSLYVAEETRVAIYEADGSLFTNDEIQALKIPGSPTGGSYELCFEGQCATLPYNASGAEIQTALEGLSTIGIGNIKLGTEDVPNNPERISFVGALAATDVPLLTVNDSALVGSSAEIAIVANGSDGHFGEGELTDTTGVAAYTYPAPEKAFKRRYVAVADSGADQIHFYSGRFDVGPNGFLPGTLVVRETDDGSELPTHELGLSAEDAYLGSDPANGHVYGYDMTHNVLNEFEPTGQIFSQTSNTSFSDASPTAIAIDRSVGANEGNIFATAGSSSGAKLLAFGPVAAPNRRSLEPLSRSFVRACGTAVDSAGNLYVAGESVIRVYDPTGAELTHIDDPHGPCYLAIDSEGNLYVADLGSHATAEDEQVDLYAPAAYPPTAGTAYTRRSTPIETLNTPWGIAVDPASGAAKDRLFVSHSGQLTEYESAAHGSGLVASHFCGSTIGFNLFGVDVYGANGDVYVVDKGNITICSPSGDEVVAQITGVGSPGGAFGALNGVSIAVNQANGNVLVGNMPDRGVVEEYEPSGAFVAQFGPFQELFHSPESQLALDDSGGATQGNLYVAYDAPTGFDLTALGPLSYGEPPVTATGTASGLGATTAILNGTVDPRGFAVSQCNFLYVTEAAYQATGFSDLSSGGEAPCAESSSEIGHEIGAVPVHTQIGGLQAAARYRFCLLAKNNFGESQCEPGLFGPPVVTTRSAQPILYTEATLRGTLDPAGLTTRYWFEYGLTESYGSTTPVRTVGAGVPSGPVQVSLIGLEEGKNYHFRLVAENEDTAPNLAVGTDRVFETLQKSGTEACPNETLRAQNRSRLLPDCRAYELVTPAESGGVEPGAGEVTDFNEWLVDPVGPSAGERITFRTFGSLPDQPGNGRLDAYLASRGTAGWSSTLTSPDFVQQGEGAEAYGVSADQLYSAWTMGGADPPGAFPLGAYLHTPAGFEALGTGSLPPGRDPYAFTRYIAPADAHLIFTTETDASHGAVQLEPDAPAPPVGAIYDHTGGTTKVVSLPPLGASPSVATAFETMTPTYRGASFDGTTVAFTVGGDLYVRRDDAETVAVAQGPLSFAGISTDGNRIFYTDKIGPYESADLYAFDLEAGVAEKIAEKARFVNVSADGSHVYYALEEGSEPKLYGWDGGSPQLVASLAPTDLQGPGVHFPGTHESDHVALDSWAAECVTVAGAFETGAGVCPSRTNPDGRYLVFQSHADLAPPPYETDGHYQVYRYDFDTEALLCLSCDPSGLPASADADLQSYGVGAPTQAMTLVPGVTADGSEVFFQTVAALLPEDANSVLDVYEWRADGTASCSRTTGCLALISSGQADTPSQIFTETPDGHDVFISTQEKLVGSDIVGSSSIYDARVDGGFPAPSLTEPCHGDACQGEAAPLPARSTIGTEATGPGNQPLRRPHHCRKGSHRVHRRCVGGKHHRRHTHPGHRHRRGHRTRRAP